MTHYSLPRHKQWYCLRPILCGLDSLDYNNFYLTGWLAPARNRQFPVGFSKSFSHKPSHQNGSARWSDHVGFSRYWRASSAPSHPPSQSVPVRSGGSGFRWFRWMHILKKWGSIGELQSEFTSRMIDSFVWKAGLLLVSIYPLVN